MFSQRCSVAEKENLPTRKKDSSRLWVVSEVYYPELTSTGYYLTAIAEGLADSFDVSALCGKPNYSVRGVKVHKRERHNEVEIYRASGTTLNKNIIFLKLINMITLSLSMLFVGLTKFRRGDRVLVVTTPPTMPFLIATASLIRGCSYTLLIHDCYPEVLVAVGKLKADSLAVRTIDFFNRWLYKHARKIVVVGRDMKKVVERKSRGLDITVDVIQNWAEIDDVKPQPRSENKLIRELGIEDKLIVLHAGNIGYPTDVETVIGALRSMNEDERFHFVFIGDGVKKRLLKKALEDHNLKNLTLLEPRPRSQQIEFLNACDIGLVSLVSGMNGAAMPSKTYNIMAAGKPILAITDEESELALVLAENQIGWEVRSGDIDSFRSALEEIYDRRNELGSMGWRARTECERIYSLTYAIGLYKEALV
jgi:colanic acid biosynthesis glycosyl transferase WcaI